MMMDGIGCVLAFYAAAFFLAGAGMVAMADWLL